MREKSSLESLDTFYKLGHSYNSWEKGEKPGDVYYTDSDEYRKLTQDTFIDMWNQKLIYKADRVSNYCPVCGTTISDADIIYRNIATDFNYIRFRIKETGEFVTIGTTRPELLCTCEMILYNPKDERYKKLNGKTIIVPLYNKEVPVKAHPYAKMDAGTGLVMMCSYGDYTDIRFFREMKLKETIAIEADGTMNENSGFLKGMKIEKARKSITEKLKSEGLLVKQERIRHRTPVCERSGNPIEFIGMPAYYLKQVDYKSDMVKVADRTRFFAPGSKQILLDWINTVSMDWPISRNRYYATEVPLWYCKCGNTIVPPKGRYYKPWKEKPPVGKCPKCGSSEFEPELAVFDTWFDSSVSPLKVLSYGTDFFRKSFPCSLRPQGKEIVRTWLYYTLLRCYHLTKKPVFGNVWIHFHVLDENGTKMSKSLGNVIDPQEIIERYGAEPFRAWCALEGNITTGDIRCSFERIEGASKFLTKLWNVARFISAFEAPKAKPSLTQVDKWILSDTARLIEKTKADYDRFDFFAAVSRIKNFIWEAFASHYLEMVKERAYNQNSKFTKEEQAAAVQTLNQVLDTIITLLSPITPFICQKIYSDLRKGDINKLEFPKPDSALLKIRLPFTTEDLLTLNGRIWKAKKDRGVSLKAEIEKIIVPDRFSSIEKELMSMHNISSVEYGKSTRITLK